MNFIVKPADDMFAEFDGSKPLQPSEFEAKRVYAKPEAVIEPKGSARKPKQSGLKKLLNVVTFKRNKHEVFQER